jgi:uncharacterized protein YacL
MLQCGLICLLGFALLGGMLYTMSVGKDNKVFKDFNATLNEDQKKKYREIASERLNLYLQGLFLGLIVAVLAMRLKLGKMLKAKTPKVCAFVVIALVINHLYYALMKKSSYMLNHLDNQEQVNAWLEIYKHMKNRKIIGMLIGVLGYVLVAWAMC